MSLMRCWIIALIWVTLIPLQLNAASKFDKSAYYSAMASGDIVKIDDEIAIVENAQISEKDGYEGALLMRKAGIEERPKDRLRYFKEGRMKFDAAVMADENNIEYHFLRLTIQEHVPNAVKYKGDLQKDKEYVIGHFNELPHVVQKAIVEYSKSSRVLHKEELKMTI